MSKNNSSWKTIDELRQRRIQREKEQERESVYTKYRDFSIDDGKDHHTIDEIRQAAIKQGYIKQPEPSPVRAAAPVQNVDFNKAAQNIGSVAGSMVNGGISKFIGLVNPDWKRQSFINSAQAIGGTIGNNLNTAAQGALDLITPGRAENRQRDTESTMIALGYYNKYDGETTYSDVQDDIKELEAKKQNAYQNNDKRTVAVYDKAIELLKNHANDTYSLMGEGKNPGVVEGRQQILAKNKETLEKLKSYRETGVAPVIDGDFVDESWMYDNDLIGRYLPKNVRPDSRAGEKDPFRKMNDYEFFTNYRDGAVPDSEENQKRFLQIKSDLIGKIEPISKELEAANQYYVENNPYEQSPSYLEYLRSPDHDEAKYYQLDYDDSDEFVQKVREKGHGMLNSNGFLFWLVKHGRKEEAENLLDAMEPLLKKDRQDKDSEELKYQVEAVAQTQRNVFHIPPSLSLLVPSIAGGVTAFGDDAIRLLTGQEIDPNNAAHFLSNVANITLNSDANAIREITKGVNLGGFDLGDAYEGVYSAVKSFTTALATNPAVAAGIMSMDAAQAKATELYNKGASQAQIIFGSLTAGAFEYVFEKISLEKVVNKLAENAGKKGLVKYITTGLAGAVAEGSEEINTSIANYIADMLIMGDKSERQELIKQFINEGYSEEEATKKANEAFIQGLYKDFMGGFIGGGVGGAGLVNFVQTGSQNKQTGKAIKEYGNMQKLYELAESMAKDKTVTKQLQKYAETVSKRGDQSSAAFKRAGKLYNAVQENNANTYADALSDERQKLLREIYAEKIDADVSEATVAPTAEILDKYISGQKLTAKEQRVVNNPKAQEILQAYRNADTDVYVEAKTLQDEAKARFEKTAELTQPKAVNIDDYNLSYDGKVYTADGTKQVDIKSVVSVGKNDIQVDLSDDTTESVKKLDLPEEMAVKYQTGLDIQEKLGVPVSAELVNEIANTEIKGKTKYWIDDVETAVKDGYTGNFATYKADSTVLSEDAYKALYEQGRKLAATHTKAQQKAVARRIQAAQYSGIQTRTESKVTFTDGLMQDSKTGTVYYTEDGKTHKYVGKDRQTGIDIVQRLAKSLGIDVVFYRSAKTGEGRTVSKFVSNGNFAARGEDAPNGFWKNGTMYLDVNASMKSREGIILFTASHELVHMIREGSPESFKELADFLIDNYAKKGVSVRDLVRDQMGDTTKLNYDEAYEEVIARACEDFLRDTHLNEKAKALYKENRTLWEKIKDALTHIVNSLKELMEKGELYEKGSISAAARLTDQMGFDIVERAHDLWIEGILESSRNLRNMEKTATKGGAKLQAREIISFNGNTNSESGEILRITSENIYKVSNEQLYNIDKDFEFRTNNKSNDIADYFESIGGVAVNPQFGIVELSKAGSKSTIFHGFGREKLASIYGIKNTIEKGTVISYDTNYKNKGYDRFIVCGKGTLFGNNETYLSVVIKSYPNNKNLNNKFYLHEVLLMNTNKETDSPIMTGTQKSEKPVSESVSMKSIPQTEPNINTSKQKNMSRYEADYDDLFDDDDSVGNLFAKEYATHHEDIGEVLRNIADIELTPAKVGAIVNRVLRENLGNLDAETRRTLSTELQLALESVNRTDPESLSNEMIAAVRKAIDGAMVTDEHAEENYNDLLNAFKGGKYYLTDEQLNQLKEHDMTLGDIRKKLYNKVNLVSRDSAGRSVSGGFTDARELSFEGLYDELQYPAEVLPFSREEWDEYGYDAPYILLETFENLKDRITVPLSEMMGSENMDDFAVNLTAKITGAIVEAKYNSKQNPYVKGLVADLRQKRNEAVKAQQEKSKQRLAELKRKERERSAQREQELREKYRESRAANYENRKRTEFRGKIRRLADNLSNRLTKPKGNHFVPQELIAQTVDVLNAIDLDSGRSSMLSDKLAKLRNKYDAMKKDAEANAVYDPVISDMLLNLSEELDNTPIMKMSLEQLKHAYDVLKAMSKVITDDIKMIDTQFKQDCHQLGREMIAELKAIRNPHIGLMEGFKMSILRPDVVFARMAGYKKNSTWSQMGRMLNDGQLRMIQLQMEFSMLFDDLVKDTKQLRRLFSSKENNMVDLGLVDEDGNSVKITRGMMLSLYMHLLNEDNARHVLGGGLTVPTMKDYYKGDMAKAYGQGMRSVRAGDVDFTKYVEGLKSKIEKLMTDYEAQWIMTAQQFFDVDSRNALNDTTMKLYGYNKAKVDHYFPIHTDANYRAANFESITKDMSLENSGFMKDRVKASNPILLEDITDVINEQIKRVSQYCGLTIPIRNFQKVYGTTTKGFETSLQKEINKKFSGSDKNSGAKKYIDHLITDLTVGRNTDDGFLSKALSKARGNLAQATLTLNPRVAIAQAASYPTAAAVIGWKPLFKAMSKGLSPADKAEIAEITPLLWYRTQGYSSAEIGDVKELRKQKHAAQSKLKKGLGWIEFFDSATVGRLYYACKYYVDDNFKDLKPGTEEYKQKVAEVYNDVIEKTQPNYTTMQRPDILRNPNAIVKSLTMFMTQRLQNFNIIYDSVGTLHKYRADFKAGINDVSKQDVRKAGLKVYQAVSSQLAASAIIAGMKLLADAITHSMNGYRDDDKELTPESITDALLWNFGDALAGNVLFGSDLFKIVKSISTGERYYGVSLSGVDSIVDMITDMTNMGTNVVQTVNGKKQLNKDYFIKLGKDICQVLGIPAANAEKLGKGIYYHVSDFSSGNGLSFEAGVERSIKQNIHRIENLYTAGKEGDAKVILQGLINDKISTGKTEKEAKSAIKSKFDELYQDRYIAAVNSNNAEEVKNIRKILHFTGLYGSMAEQDIALTVWTIEDRFEKEKDKYKADSMGLALDYEYDKAYVLANARGYSETDCKKKAETAARSAVTKGLKDRYLAVLASNDTKTVNEIKNYMVQSGYYHSTKKNGTDLSRVDEVLDGWRKNQEEADERAAVAAERQK